MSENKSRRGFAAMDSEAHRAIASKGGRSAHAKGTARKFAGEEAATAGAKRGRAAHEQGTAHEFTAEEVRAPGSKGGRANVGDRPARVAEAAGGCRDAGPGHAGDAGTPGRNGPAVGGGADAGRDRGAVRRDAAGSGGGAEDR